MQKIKQSPKSQKSQKQNKFEANPNKLGIYSGYLYQKELDFVAIHMALKRVSRLFIISFYLFILCLRFLATFIINVKHDSN